jgi:hypothetical protein
LQQWIADLTDLDVDEVNSDPEPDWESLVDEAFRGLDYPDSKEEKLRLKYPHIYAALDKVAPLRNEEVERMFAEYEMGNFYTSGQSDFLQAAERMGYDGVRMFDHNTEGQSLSYVVFDSNQIKLADAVVKDEEGNVIPLSWRFNEESDDIRETRMTPAKLMMHFMGESNYKWAMQYGMEKGSVSFPVTGEYFITSSGAVHEANWKYGGSLEPLARSAAFDYLAKKLNSPKQSVGLYLLRDAKNMLRQAGFMDKYG